MFSAKITKKVAKILGILFFIELESLCLIDSKKTTIFDVFY